MTFCYNIYGFNCSYNQFTYKFDFSATCDFFLDFSQSDFYKIVSLEKKIYSSSNNQFSSGIVDFNKPYYININFSNITNNVMIGSTNQQVNFIVLK